MKKVYICSPLRGDIEANIARAKGYCRQAVEAGVLPICPHVFFADVLDDTIPAERRLGMGIGLTLLEICDELWYWPGKDGVISKGMQAEIKLARELGIDCRLGKNRV